MNSKSEFIWVLAISTSSLILVVFQCPPLTDVFGLPSDLCLGSTLIREVHLKMLELAF